jgi:hypothetical protein
MPGAPHAWLLARRRVVLPPRSGGRANAVLRSRGPTQCPLPRSQPRPVEKVMRRTTRRASERNRGRSLSPKPRCSPDFFSRRRNAEDGVPDRSDLPLSTLGPDEIAPTARPVLRGDRLLARFFVGQSSLIIHLSFTHRAAGVPTLFFYPQTRRRHAPRTTARLHVD